MSKPLVLALGTFDGLHLGHRALINRTLELARLKGASPACYTFSNVPASFHLHLSNIQLMSREHKEDLLRKAGIEVIIMRDFDDGLMKTDPEDFVRDLMNHYPISHMVVGKDFRFGSRGKGTSLYLKSLGALYGYETEIIDFVFDEEGKLSSSRLRARLREGNMEAVRKMLGRNYSFLSPILRADDGEGGPRYLMRPSFDIAPLRMGYYKALVIGPHNREEVRVRVMASVAPAFWEVQFYSDGAGDFGDEVYELEFLDEIEDNRF